jgi:type IV pilus biogenesis protein CpaD/CtpE
MRRETRTPRARRHLAGAAALLALLAGCQAPSFPPRAAPVGPAATGCPDWSSARLSHPIDPLVGNPSPAEELRLGCASDANLARMVADPADLRGEAVTGPAPASNAAGAVQRYHANQVTPLPEPHTTFGGSP